MREIKLRWVKIRSLYDKILYWLYRREIAEKALPFASELEPLLEEADPHHESILGEECRALIAETRGNFPKAVEYRESEVNLIKLLHKISIGRSYEKIALDKYNYSDLSDKLDLLANCHYNNNNLEKAIEVLQESKTICEKHKLAFDGDEMLEDYLAEKSWLDKKSQAV